MILKVLQADTGKWFYYDKICLFKVKYGVRDVNEPIAEDQIVLLPEKRNPEDTVARCDVNFEDGRYLEIIFSDEGYLLNDVGKTIETIA